MEMRDGRRICFIVNRTAGSGKCAALFDRAEAALRARNAQYTVHYTEYGGHAIELTRRAIDRGERFIVAAGGDGTVSEVASVLCGRCGITFGILPFGTGNDVAGNLGLPPEPERAAELLLDGVTRPIDMGRANGRTFINAGGFGFDVDVIMNTEKHKRGRSGMLPYLLGIISTIFNRRRIHAIIDTGDGRVEKDIIVAVVANGERFGGGMKIAPGARTNDGLLDVCIIEYVGLPRFLVLLMLFIKGKHVGRKPVLFFRASRLSIITDAPCPIQLDGEIIESTPVEYRVIPNALSVIAPDAPERT